MRFLFMLEDDLDRIQRFKAILAKRHPGSQVEIHRTAHSFIAAYKLLAATPCLICLDHDLFVDSPNDPDPGDGRDVSEFLRCCRSPLSQAIFGRVWHGWANKALYLTFLEPYFVRLF